MRKFRFDGQSFFTITKVYIPHPVLREFVATIMVIDALVDDHLATAVSPYPPTPQQSLFFYIADPIQMKHDGKNDFEVQARSVIVGPQITRVQLVVGKHHKAVRVGFQPGGLYRLLGIPMYEMLDEGLDASLFFGSIMKEVQEQLFEAPDYDSIKNIIEHFLISHVNKLKPSHPFDIVMRKHVGLDGQVSLENLASDSCLSYRQFERVSNQRIGLRPKLFSRIIRFSRAYRLSEASIKMNWTSIAHECGYFDQMHLIRDFKEFAGVNPGIIEHELSSTPFRLQKDLQL